MKYCQNCGAPCQDVDMICKSCGCMLEDTGLRQQTGDTEKRQYTESGVRTAGSQTQDGNLQSGQTGFTGSSAAQGDTGNSGYRNYSSDSSTYSSQQNYQQPYSSYTPYPRTNGMAIASLVLGIVGFLFLWCRGFGLIAAVLAIIFGAMARGSIKQSGNTQTGSGFATAGLVLGIVTISLGILIGLLILCGLAVSGIFTGIGLSGSRVFDACQSL